MKIVKLGSTGPLNIEVCFTPALLPLYKVEDSIVVVIDIFRATSSICYGIDNGAVAIIPVSKVEECAAYHGTDCLLAAERDGEVVAGFNFGNSPFAYTADKVAGRTIVLTTTNGTQAIRLAAKAKKILIGSFFNLSILCEYLSQANENVLLVCAGWKNKFNLEDSVFAGAVVHRLKESGFKLDDSSIAAEDLYMQAKDDLKAYLKKTSHSDRLRKLGIEEDIAFCLNVDITHSIPVLEADKLVKLEI